MGGFTQVAFGDTLEDIFEQVTVTVKDSAKVNINPGELFVQEPQKERSRVFDIEIHRDGDPIRYWEYPVRSVSFAEREGGSAIDLDQIPSNERKPREGQLVGVVRYHS